MMQRFATRWFFLAAAVFMLAPSAAVAQLPLDPLSKPADSQPNLLSQPTLSSGTAYLFDLEAKFAADVAKGGGPAFASWFAEDGITLSNGKAPVVGRLAIAAQAKWAAKDYQLTWTPTGGQISAQGDMGFTFGHYEGRSKDAQGNPVITSGRYFTVWKRQPNGEWKVALDASQDEPADDCCSLKQP
jgi:ketosteroid isomerase-like protein